VRERYSFSEIFDGNFRTWGVKLGLLDKQPLRNLMPTSMQPQFEEKRFALRMALRLPIVVSGRAEDGAAWSEPTETDDISTLGALFQLNQKISEGDTLYIRSHRPDGVPVEVKARVARIGASTYGTSRVGVSIIESKDNWLRLFVAWIADDNVVEGIEE
jgi:hypothetical protein